MSNHEVATPEEQRALSREELKLADKSRQPVFGKLSGRELSDLVSLLRDGATALAILVTGRAVKRAARQNRPVSRLRAATRAPGQRAISSTKLRIAPPPSATAANLSRRTLSPDDEGVSQAELAQGARTLKEENSKQSEMLEEGTPFARE